MLYMMLNDPLSTLNAYNHTLRALAYLDNQVAPLNQTQVKEGMGLTNVTTLVNSLDVLEELGLIETKMEMPRTKWITLTEKGRKAAELVAELSRLLT